MNIDIFSNKTFLELIDCIFKIYSNQDFSSKRFKTRRYYLPKGIIDNYNITINGKTFMTKQLVQIENKMNKVEKQQ